MYTSYKTSCDHKCQTCGSSDISAEKDSQSFTCNMCNVTVQQITHYNKESCRRCNSKNTYAFTNDGGSIQGCSDCGYKWDAIPILKQVSYPREKFALDGRWMPYTK